MCVKMEGVEIEAPHVAVYLQRGASVRPAIINTAFERTICLDKGLGLDPKTLVGSAHPRHREAAKP
jgi:hypothetical protein